MNELPIYIVDLKEGSDEMLINSLVDEPAHRHYFIAQASKQYEFSINEEKREITGVVIAANQPIYYYSEEIPECYLVFKPDTIKSIAINYFKNNRFNVIDVNHDFAERTSAATLLETYFARKNNEFNVDEGSWIATYKIHDNELWQKIKNKEIKGYSIAGNFSLLKLQFNHKPIKSNAMNIVEKLKKVLMEEVQMPLNNVKGVDGKDYIIEGELKEGSKLYVVASDGTKVLAPEGEYMLVFNEVVVKATVDEFGVIKSMEQQEAKTEQDLKEQLEQAKKEVEELKKLVEQRFKSMEDALLLAVKEINMKMSAVKPVNVEEKKEIKLKIK